jgi:hypothetical protein
LRRSATFLLVLRQWNLDRHLTEIPTCIAFLLLGIS